MTNIFALFCSLFSNPIASVSQSACESCTVERGLCLSHPSPSSSVFVIISPSFLLFAIHFSS